MLGVFFPRNTGHIPMDKDSPPIHRNGFRYCYLYILEVGTKKMLQ